MKKYHNMEREDAKTLDVLVEKYLSKFGIAKELTRIQVFEAWNKAVGKVASDATVNKFFKDGILYCTISSSVLRSQLYFQIDVIKKKINGELSSPIVNKIVLK